MHWYGINDSRDVEKLASTEKCFWWIWTAEPTSDWWEKPFHHASTLPNSSLRQLETQNLSTRGLKAVLYCNDERKFLGLPDDDGRYTSDAALY